MKAQEKSNENGECPNGDKRLTMCNRKTMRGKVENILTFCEGPNVTSVAARSWQMVMT